MIEILIESDLAANVVGAICVSFLAGHAARAVAAFAFGLFLAVAGRRT